MGGSWRQRAKAQVVRTCNFEGACLGGAFVGDALCAPGHYGPLCDVCEPAYVGGRGKACELCSEAGDVDTTIGFAIGIGVVGILLVLAIGWGCKKWALHATASLIESIGSARDTDELKENLRDEALATREMAKTDCKRRCMARVVAAVSSVGVKIRILISLYQVGPESLRNCPR